jgi:hypothetical protein
MATCISRRACADRDTLRLIDKEGKPGRHIWVEYRCHNKVIVDGQICADCSYKLPKYKYQANPKCDHGIIGGPYPSDSKLYGSGFYLKLIKDGWKILEADELRAKAAVDNACMGRKKVVAGPNTEVESTVKAEPAVQAEPVAQAGPVAQADVQVKQKRAYKKKTPEEKAAKAVKAVKSGKPVKLDVLLPTPPQILPAEEIHHDPKFIESVAPPITIEEFITVKVKKMNIQGKPYFYDANSGKLYGVSVNGVGAYKGRYDSEKDIVDTSFPDSDNEESE